MRPRQNLRRNAISVGAILRALVAVTFVILCPASAFAQAAPAPSGDLLELYRQLRAVPLDPAQVFHIREAVFDREELHIYLNDGTIAFTKDVGGHITGAFFEGEGEVLLRPPDLAEKTSLGLFTGLGVLDEKFGSAYFRFNDETFADLQRYMIRDADSAATFIEDHGRVAVAMAAADSLRLLGTYSSDASRFREPDHYLHARLIGRLGIFDVVYDSLAPEQFLVGGLRMKSTDEATFNLWMSFPSGRVRRMSDRDRARRFIDPWRSSESVKINSVRTDTHLLPPEQIEASAELDCTVINGGQRLLVFELSRFLRVDSAQLDGQPVTVLQNEALTGSELARRGNDLVSIFTPKPLVAGQQLHLRFHYAGPVMSKAAEGLLFVGDRGTWYPNRGIAMANFQLRFHWPAEWTLVASGKRLSLEQEGDELTGEWRSEGVVPVAGFNLGKYIHTSARAGGIQVDTFATAHVEETLAERDKGKRIQRPTSPNDIVVVLPPDRLDPSQGAQSVADTVGKAVTRYSQWYGPFPYSGLALTQFPADSSQGWPGLIFLASSSFLTPQERARIQMSPFARVLYGETMQAHETAHQWWGDLVGFKTYRDQWISEGLANYSALMLLEETKPQDVKFLLDSYRGDLEHKNADGRPFAEAGPVTLGFRLTTSMFPEGYIIITYGRGTWLIHMLRSMFRDPSAAPALRDARFFNSLRSLRDNFQRKEVSLDDFRKAFEANMPPSLEYQGQHSLAWFFDGWVRGTAIPRLDLKEVKISPRGQKGTASFTIEQAECPDDLITSVPLYAVDAKGARTYAGRVFADGHETRESVTVPAGTKKLLLDPDETILRRK